MVVEEVVAASMWANGGGIGISLPEVLVSLGEMDPPFCKNDISPAHKDSGADVRADKATDTWVPKLAW